MLTEFLLARIAEDEVVARLAQSVIAGTDGDWQDVTQPLTLAKTLAGELWAQKYGYAYEHIARHDPARVLAECEAKRRIVEAHRKQVEDDDPRAWIVASQIALRSLAAVYADHPDYDEAWRP